MSRILQLILIGALAAVTYTSLAHSDTPSSNDAGSSPVTFIPPSEGPPAGRVGAGTRSTEIRDNGLIRLVVPVGGGETASGSPTLVWAFSEDVEGELSLELLDSSNDRLWLKFRESGRWKAGLNGLSLADFGVTIEKGHILSWKMSFVANTGSGPPSEVRSLVERASIDPPSQADGANAMRSLAAAGLWFDALSAGARLTTSDAFEIVDLPNTQALLASAGAN